MIWVFNNEAGIKSFQEFNSAVSVFNDSSGVMDLSKVIKNVLFKFFLWHVNVAIFDGS